MKTQTDPTLAGAGPAPAKPACPLGITPGELQQRIGARHCRLLEACLHLGLHRHGTQCPHLVFLDREDKLRD